MVKKRGSRRTKFCDMRTPPDNLEGSIFVDLKFRGRNISVEFKVADVEVMWYEDWTSITDATLKEIWVWDARQKDWFCRWLSLDAEDVEGPAELTTPLGEALWKEEFEELNSDFWMKFEKIIPMLGRMDIEYYADNEEKRECGLPY